MDEEQVAALLTREQFDAWLAGKGASEIVGYCSSFTGCVLVTYLHEHGVPDPHVWPSAVAGVPPEVTYQGEGTERRAVLLPEDLTRVAWRFDDLDDPDATIRADRLRAALAESA